MFIASAVTIPVVLLLVFGAVLFAAQAITANCPEGERVRLDDLLTEEDDS